MGACLCKGNKTEDEPHDCNRPNIGNPNADTIGQWPRYDRKCSLAETVDRLIKETLDLIGTLVDK